MAFIPTPNTVQVEVRWSLDSQRCENRFYVDTHAPVTTASIIAVSDLVQEWVETEYTVVAPGAVTFSELVVTDASVADGEQRTVAIGLAGTSAVTALPNECSLCISLRSGFTGRSRRGRFYPTPPGTSQMVSNNTVTTAYRNALVALLQSLITQLHDAGFDMCVVSFVSNGVPRAAGFITRYNTATTVDNIIDSQRRRKPGNGS